MVLSNPALIRTLPIQLTKHKEFLLRFPKLLCSSLSVSASCFEDIAGAGNRERGHAGNKICCLQPPTKGECRTAEHHLPCPTFPLTKHKSKMHIYKPRALTSLLMQSFPECSMAHGTHSQPVLAYQWETIETAGLFLTREILRIAPCINGCTHFPLRDWQSNFCYEKLSELLLSSNTKQNRFETRTHSLARQHQQKLHPSTENSLVPESQQESTKPYAEV